MWHILLAGVAVALIIEGLAYSLAPRIVVRLLELLRALPEEQVRWVGLSTCTAGIIMLYGVFAFLY